MNLFTEYVVVYRIRVGDNEYVLQIPKHQLPLVRHIEHLGGGRFVITWEK